MTTDTALLIEMIVTLAIVLLILGYLRPFLRRILIDLCGTDERAQFWTTFSNILLLSLPMITALGFYPKISLSNPLLVVAQQLKSNLMSFIVGLILIGVVLLFFTLIVSRASTREEPK